MKIKNISTMDHLNNRPYMFEVGSSGVIEIIQHKAQGEGDKWYYDIIHDNGQTNVRLFDFYSVGFEGDPE